MPIDGVFLRCLTKELKLKILNGKIRKIIQFEKYSIILSIRCNRENHDLLLSSNSKYSTINLTNAKYKNPDSSFMFQTILKKYILNGTIKDIVQIENDRILKLIIDNRDELGDVKTFELIVELMGKHSNISLINSSNHTVLDSIKHLSANNNSYRVILPGSTYKFPPQNELKLNPFNFDFKDLERLLNITDFEENMYSKIFQGVSVPLSKFIFDEMKSKSPENKFNYLKNLFEDIKNAPTIYLKNGNYKDFYCFDINILCEKVKVQNLNSLLDDFISNKNTFDSLNNKIMDLKKFINSIIQRCNKKICIFEETLKTTENKDIFKLYGDLIAANIFMLKGGEESIIVQNYFSEDYENVKINLNSKLNASGNIEFYYKKFKKLKKSEIMNKKNIQECSQEITYLNSVLNNIEKITNENDINEIREELIASGYLKKAKNKSKNNIIKSNPYHYITSNGVSIFIGKNNIQNEYLTFKMSKKDFVWFHVKNVPGSHVILAHNNPSDKLIDICGKLAAFYSKASSSSNVPVDFTKIKNVKKMPHAKPGMVIYTSYNTIYATPPLSIDELNLSLKEG